MVANCGNDHDNDYEQFDSIEELNWKEREYNWNLP